jgi:hypothetical protein
LFCFPQSVPPVVVLEDDDDDILMLDDNGGGPDNVDDIQVNHTFFSSFQF